jgi:NAD(P)-dependent dehydrogenase (short-subunit alcohol dehydrogenase family)
MNTNEFKGRSVLIAGAGGGIGRATANLCAEAGARVVLADIVAADLIRERANLGPGVEASYFQCDSSSRSAVEAMAERAGPIDILVDAGGLCPRDDWMAPDWDEAFTKVIDVNVRGPINLARAFMPAMMERGNGRIVLCGSIAGWAGGVRSSPHYAAAKGGVHSLVRWLAQRATPKGVTVNGVAPGPVDSDMTAGAGYTPEAYPLKRMGTPDEIANLIVFLCSPGASYVSGTVIDANGGIYMR